MATAAALPVRLVTASPLPSVEELEAIGERVSVAIEGAEHLRDALKSAPNLLAAEAWNITELARDLARQGEWLIEQAQAIATTVEEAHARSR